ncbi:macrophage expressed gene 1 [Rattus norvegicus]|uniref:Macrophage expressed gene 1 n=1 Tax=Rattus norvegicus TaxID=10116 RepID=A6I0D6_RAT|nr:macrophage expressed gene 1 [Rattus norvegicus]
MDDSHGSMKLQRLSQLPLVGLRILNPGSGSLTTGHYDSVGGNLAHEGWLGVRWKPDREQGPSCKDSSLDTVGHLASITDNS